MSILEMKVDALMRLCTAETDEDRAEALAVCRKLLHSDNDPAPAAKSADLDTTIRSILRYIGVPDHLRGHAYLVTALEITAEDPSSIGKIVKQIYHVIAKRHNTTATGVDRAIRNAIEITWDRGNPGVLAKYFGNTVNSRRGVPTNKEFISRIANVIREQV